MTSRFANLPDYIQGVTHEIWEGRDIASLHQAYGKTMVARSTLGVMVGRRRGDPRHPRQSGRLSRPAFVWAMR